MISEFPVFTVKIEHAHTVYTGPSLSQREGPGDEATELKNKLTMWLCTVGLNMFHSLQFGGDNTKTVFVAEWVAFFGVPLMPRVRPLQVVLLFLVLRPHPFSQTSLFQHPMLLRMRRATPRQTKPRGC